MKEMVRLQGITKKFGNNVIIPSLDLTIYDGEFITLLGPSGCGKTTLLRMIAGLETPTEGSIYLDDENVTALPPYKRDVNMVFQHYALFPHMTVEENIKFGLMMKKVPADEQKERVAQVLYLTQLEEFRNRRPQQMSGGQQQRVNCPRFGQQSQGPLTGRAFGRAGLPAAQKSAAGTEKPSARSGSDIHLCNARSGRGIDHV